MLFPGDPVKTSDSDADSNDSDRSPSAPDYSDIDMIVSTNVSDEKNSL
jgi:hypothetical protein